MTSKIARIVRVFFALPIIIWISALLFQSCSTLHDVRPKVLKQDGISEENTKRGKLLLDQVWEKQGGSEFQEYSVYSFNGFDTWKDNKLGEIGKLWPDFKTNLEFKFQVDTLDGKITFIDGERAGDIAGICDSKYYEIKNGKAEFKDRNAEENIRVVFGLYHIQYFFELLNRLRNAPIISYAGEEEFNGNKYDLVFCTWGEAKPHQEHDQYLLWINQETGFLDYSEYSVREPYAKPIGYKLIGGNIQYLDYREIDGVWIPHNQIVYPFKKRTKQEKFIHNLKISNFQFDNFNAEELKQINN